MGCAAPAAPKPAEPPAPPQSAVYITWKEWETAVEVGSERLDDGFKSIDGGPRVFYSVAEGPGTQLFNVGGVTFHAYAEEKPQTVKHTICSAGGGSKWWVGPCGVDKQPGREQDGDGWELTGTFWASQSKPGAAPAAAAESAPAAATEDVAAAAKAAEEAAAAKAAEEEAAAAAAAAETKAAQEAAAAAAEEAAAAQAAEEAAAAAAAAEAKAAQEAAAAAAEEAAAAQAAEEAAAAAAAAEAKAVEEAAAAAAAEVAAPQEVIITHATNEGEYLYGTLFDDGDNRRTVCNWMSGGDPLEDPQAKWMIKELADGTVTITLSGGDLAGNYFYATAFEPEDGRRRVAAYMTGAAEDDEQAKWFKRMLDDGSCVLVSKLYEGNYLYASGFDDSEGRRTIYCWANGGDPAEDPCARWKITPVA